MSPHLLSLSRILRVYGKPANDWSMSTAIWDAVLQVPDDRNHQDSSCVSTAINIRHNALELQAVRLIYGTTRMHANIYISAMVRGTAENVPLLICFSVTDAEVHKLIDEALTTRELRQTLRGERKGISGEDKLSCSQKCSLISTNLEVKLRCCWCWREGRGLKYLYIYI